LRVSKGTRSRLRKLALAKRESYDEIINRLLGLETEEKKGESLEEKRKMLIKSGISKELADLVGILPKSDARDDKELIGNAIRHRFFKKG
jgi:hypothetical protein